MIRVIALNRDVSSMSHCIEIISHSFSILSSVESASIPCMSSLAIVTHLRMKLRTCVLPKNLLGPFVWL